ncbi:FtsQ-type POTRA domain-containing protein [Cryobacterium tepidiphilum]|uniref:FtsQ-type POTRA domain-containing protein n=1 Tax=Cryobacterium tepidiphilum TaxID=2486026 RepID=A0A3M8L3F5_9MICO|nr:FtsQ-type POTRA domain-containing protein [Cryobacterium tepidiphilum]RNE59449.1 FtsQ-type POTRA domain-containing protein [Cryobacterium tepidiphilum]
MRRPQAFTPPPAPPVPPPASPPRDRTRQAPTPRPSRNDPITEPIAVQAATPPVTEREHEPSAPPLYVPADAGADADTGVDADADGDADGPSSRRPALAAVAARRQLRAARRARKKYEREEVRRFTWRSRRRRRAWLAALGVVAALAAFVLVGVYSPVMALRQVQVVGAERLPADKVEAALADQLGTPLPLIDSAEVKSALAPFTIIQSFRTESRPPHTLVVRLVEREPVGVIARGSRFDLVDAAGVVIETSAKRPDGYPKLVAGDTDGAGFRAATAVVRALPDGIRGTLREVHAGTADDVTLTLSGGARVVWGSAERSDDKAAVLTALMVSHPAGSVDEYDVTSPDSPVIR